MLNGPTDSHGDIQVRCDNFASLSNLHIIGHVACVDSRTRSSDGAVLAAQSAGKVVKQLKVFAIFKTTTSADHKFGASKVGHVRFADDVLLPGAFDSFRNCISILNRVSIARICLRDLVEISWPYSQELD